jgi:hypothetical protein
MQTKREKERQRTSVEAHITSTRLAPILRSFTGLSRSLSHQPLRRDTSHRRCRLTECVTHACVTHACGGEIHTRNISSQHECTHECIDSNATYVQNGSLIVCLYYVGGSCVKGTISRERAERRRRARESHHARIRREKEAQSLPRTCDSRVVSREVRGAEATCRGGRRVWEMKKVMRDGQV